MGWVVMGRRDSAVNHSSPREPCGEWAPGSVIDAVQVSTNQVSVCAGVPKEEQAASRPLADRTEKAVDST